MNRVPREANDELAMTRPCFPTFTVIGVVGLLVLMGVSWAWNRHKESSPTAPATVESGASQPATEDGASFAAQTAVTAPVAVVTRGQSRSEPDALVASTGGSVVAQELIAQLTQLKITGGKLTLEQGQQIQQSFQQLVREGGAALPAIRALLDQNQDWTFGKWTGGSVGPPSVRAGLIDALSQIGGPEAVALSQHVLQNTADPLEISLLARNLEQAEPGQHSEQVMQIANSVLEAAATGILSNLDVGPLFQTMQAYGGAGAAQQFEKLASQWGHYAILGLAEMPNGQGVSSLARLAVDSSPAGIGNRDFALQMLAQDSAANGDAGSALVELARQNKVADSAWRGIADVLGGLQYQFSHSYPDNVFAPVDGQDFRSHRQQNGNQNFVSTSVPSDSSATDPSQRLATIDQLLSVVSGNPAAVDALNQARAKLSAGVAAK